MKPNEMCTHLSGRFYSDVYKTQQKLELLLNTGWTRSCGETSNSREMIGLSIGQRLHILWANANANDHNMRDTKVKRLQENEVKKVFKRTDENEETGSDVMRLWVGLCAVGGVRLEFCLPPTGSHDAAALTRLLLFLYLNCSSLLLLHTLCCSLAVVCCRHLRQHHLWWFVVS